jgi:hypothetical protein
VKVENKEKHKDKSKEKKEKKEKKKEKEVAAAVAAAVAVGGATSTSTKVCRTVHEQCLCMFPYSITHYKIYTFVNLYHIRGIGNLNPHATDLLAGLNSGVNCLAVWQCSAWLVGLCVSCNT